jgi:drug/metabolite transporter (DMT)-like permease
MLIGAAVLGTTALLLERPFEQHWTSNAVLSVLYLALLGTVLTFGVYQWLLRFVPAYRLSLVSFVTPVIALLLGAAAASEPIGSATVLGTAFVLGGMALALVRPVKRL